MKKLFAIINLTASIPVIVGAFGLARIISKAEPLDEINEFGITGGADGPTEIFITCEPDPLSILILGIYAALFLMNGFMFWNSQSRTSPLDRTSQAQSGQG